MRAELTDWSPEQLRRLRERDAVSEHVCGLVLRSRTRCAQCTAVHDVLLQHPIVVLDLDDNVYTSLQDLWQHRVREHRGEQQRCPVGCGANGYKQDFLEREPPVMIFILKRFCKALVDGRMRVTKERRRVDFPQVLDCMRSGEYHFAASVQHQGRTLGSGHYVATVWEGDKAGADHYREISDTVVGESVAWDALPFEELQADAYVLVYVRTRFWSDSVRDGSECTPYLRDRATVEVAGRYFRGRPALPATEHDSVGSDVGAVVERAAEEMPGAASSSSAPSAAVVERRAEAASGSGAGSSGSRPSLLRPRASRASRVVSVHDANPLETAALRDAEAAARARRRVEGEGRGRVVDVDGEEFLEAEARGDEEALARARRRVQEGERGRAVDFQGRDIDRSSGGPSRPLG